MICLSSRPNPSKQQLGAFLVTLPSKHTGGILTLSDNGSTLRLNSEPISTFGYSIAAWNDGVSQQLSPINSGCRLAIYFEILAKSTETRSLFSAFTEYRKAFKDLIVAWNIYASNYEESPIIFRLEHTYSKRLMFQHGADALHKKDKVLAKFLLQERDRGVNFHFYIVKVTRYVVGEVPDHEDDFCGGYSRYSPQHGHDSDDSDGDSDESPDLGYDDLNIDEEM